MYIVSFAPLAGALSRSPVLLTIDPGLTEAGVALYSGSFTPFPPPPPPPQKDPGYEGKAGAEAVDSLFCTGG